MTVVTCDDLQKWLREFARLIVENNAGEQMEVALAKAQAAAEQGRDDTIPMLAKKGRASYLGERSVGHQDPGATSTALLFTAAAAALT